MNQCNLNIKYDDERWATIVTQAEEDCIEYIKTHKILTQSTALDVGIGASFFFAELQHLFTKIDGLTVIDKEIDIANKLSEQSSTKYNLIKQNKHDVLELDKKLDKEYPVIVDVNLKMFACCQKHWEDYFYYIISKLSKNGELLTHTVGFGGYKNEIFKSELTLVELENLISFSGKNISLTSTESTLIPNHSLIILRAEDD